MSRPSSIDDIRARKYGRWNASRAPSTAIRLAASRLRNHTPPRPSWRTYVRTLTSGNAPAHWRDGQPARGQGRSSGTGRCRDRRDRRTCRSPARAGTSGRSASTGTGQCAKSRSCQRMRTTHGRRRGSTGVSPRGPRTLPGRRWRFRRPVPVQRHRFAVDPGRVVGAEHDEVAGLALRSRPASAP